MHSRGAIRLTQAALVVLLGLGPVPSGAQDYAPGEVVVRFEEGVSPARIAEIEGALSVELLREIAHLRLRHYALPESLTVPEALEALSTLSEVASAEPNTLFPVQAIPTDPWFGSQWALHNIGQTVNGTAGLADADIDWAEALDRFTGLAPVTVAVIDTGMALDHPELLPNVWLNPDETENGLDDDGNGYVDDLFGWNFFNGNNIPLDDRGHGTGVASIVASAIGNGEGGAGIVPAPTARLMPLRVADDVFGFGTPIVSLINFLLSTTYAADEGAAIINFSAGGSSPSASMQAQIAWLDSHGVLLIAAAGNGLFSGDAAGDDNDLFPVYPASYANPNIIAVAATDQQDSLAAFSNFGATSVDLAAPGTNIFVSDVSRAAALIEGFESGAPGWTVGNFCTLFCDDWTIWIDALFNRWLNDGSNDVFGNPINYLSLSDTFAVSPSVPLVFGPILSFREWHALSIGDIFLVEISTDGISWDLLGSLTGFSTSSPPGTALPAGDLRAFDLTAYEGQPVQLRFSLISDSLFQADGIYVDDVLITHVEIFSYDGTQYQFSDGTSFSAPMVAGAAALIAAQRPDLSHLEIKQIILDNVDSLPSLSGKIATGGRLNAHQALEAAIASFCGDVDDDGLLATPDIALYQEVLAELDTLSGAGVAKCNAIDAAGPCTIRHLAVIKRAIDSPGLLPGIAPVCTGATAP